MYSVFPLVITVGSILLRPNTRTLTSILVGTDTRTATLVIGAGNLVYSGIIVVTFGTERISDLPLGDKILLTGLSLFLGTLLTGCLHLRLAFGTEICLRLVPPTVEILPGDILSAPPVLPFVGIGGTHHVYRKLPTFGRTKLPFNNSGTFA